MSRTMKVLRFGFLCLTLLAIAAPVGRNAPEAKVTPLFSKDLKEFPGNKA